jgi:hypothetical protein
MKLICFFTAFLFLGCCQSRKEISIDKSIVDAEKVILDTENILKKIPTSEKYKELRVKYTTNKGAIYLSYGNFDNNYYRIDTLNSIKYLTINEFKELKNNIYKLSKIGLGDQDYVIYNPDVWKGIYIYTYKFEDWMLDNPEKTPYISLVKNLDEKDEWFNNTFKKVSQKKPIVLLTKIKG